MHSAAAFLLPTTDPRCAQLGEISTRGQFTRSIQYRNLQLGKYISFIFSTPSTSPTLSGAVSKQLRYVEGHNRLVPVLPVIGHDTRPGGESNTF